MFRVKNKCGTGHLPGRRLKILPVFKDNVFTRRLADAYDSIDKIQVAGGSVCSKEEWVCVFKI